jgi:hypothetical protein
MAATRGFCPTWRSKGAASTGTAGGGRKGSTTRGAAGRRSGPGEGGGVQQRRSGGGREEGRRRGLKRKLREMQGLHCKTSITFKPVLTWRWSQKQKCIVYQALQLWFKVHLQKSNSFEVKIKLSNSFKLYVNPIDKTTLHIYPRVVLPIFAI